jgi:multidrug efflux system membrane fusion protein
MRPGGRDLAVMSLRPSVLTTSPELRYCVQQHSQPARQPTRTCMRLTKLNIVALACAALAIGWFVFGTMFRAGGDAPAAAPVERFRVIVHVVAPTSFEGALTVRGQTRADTKVSVRADVSGVVEATPVAEGARVKEGATLCRLDREARGAEARQAQAALEKARIDYDAGVRLAAEGYRSEAGLAGLKAARDQAQAAYDAARLTLGKTEISAPFDGVFNSRAVDVGDLMKSGDECGVMIRDNPFVIEGAVSERDIGRIRRGNKGKARLATGETIDGVVRYVASAADPATRTFRVELEVPNPDGTLRDGVTADFVVESDAVSAHRVPRSSLTLDDDGRLGVKSVAADGRVRFHPVELGGEDGDSVFVLGLEGPIALITRGQDFVAEGQAVEIAEAAL